MRRCWGASCMLGQKPSLVDWGLSRMQEAGADVPENVREARAWIKGWRARSLEARLPQEESAVSNA